MKDIPLSGYLCITRKSSIRDSLYRRPLMRRRPIPATTVLKPNPINGKHIIQFILVLVPRHLNRTNHFYCKKYEMLLSGAITPRTILQSCLSRGKKKILKFSTEEGLTQRATAFQSERRREYVNKQSDSSCNNGKETSSLA